MSSTELYYIKRKSRLLREFDFTTRSAWAVLDRYFPGEDIPSLVAETRREFANLIPQLPYLGGKQPFTRFIVNTAMLLAVYRVARLRGRTVEQIGELSYEIGQALIQSMPAFLLRLFTPMNFSQSYLKRLHRASLESHKRIYPEGYVFDFVPGDGKTFDYGVDYLECASCKFLAKQGAAELAPYICPADILYSEALNWGLVRTQTLAEGADRCDFRFKKGGITRVNVPPALQTVIWRKDNP